MKFITKVKDRTPNDEFEIKSLEDEYINYVYDKIYARMHSIALTNFGRAPIRTLEIGAGSLSKAEKYFHNVQLSDGSSVSKFGKENQLIAENLPFENETFDLIIAKDTLHHFSDTDKALSEISRVLKPGGLFIVSEPYWSLLGRFIFRFIHPEKWVTRPLDLTNLSENPYDANQATLYCLRKSQFKNIVSKNSLSIQVYNSTYGVSYLISGGLNWRTKVPFSILSVIDRIESTIKLQKHFTGLNVMACFKKV
jgi:SAM-dependent methyltransferase